MGALPSDVFAGGIPGGMMDGSIPRPVARMRGGGSVQYMQAGGVAKPNMREFMDATGVDAATASQLLYGSVGSNKDIRDWNAIMGSNDPTRAAQEATRQMYSTGAPVATDPRFYTDGQYTPTKVQYISESGEVATPVAGTNLKVLDGNIYITDAAGLPLTGLSPQNAASFGISQADIDAAVAASGIDSEYASRFQGVGYQPYEAGNLLRSDYMSLLTGSPTRPVSDAGVNPYDAVNAYYDRGILDEQKSFYENELDVLRNQLSDLQAAYAGPRYTGVLNPVSYGMPEGASYQPTLGSIPTFTRGVSDMFGTRPVTYYGSPQATITSGIGSIDLPARPESVNVFDWLADPVSGVGLYRPGSAS
jgi:hypothetical protein